jgi:hypothetical protein
MNSSASQFLSPLLCAFSVTLEGNTLTLLGKSQNNVSRNCKERAQTFFVMFGNKLVLVYSAIAWVREKHIISKSSAWTRQGGSKVKGRVERKLSTFVLFSQQLIFMLSKLRNYIVPSVGASVYHK